jgi:hypothetical protein
LRLPHIRDPEFNVPLLQSRSNHSFLCTFNHLRRKIYTDDSAFFPDFASSQNNIDPATATEIHDNIPRLKVRKSSGIATSPGEIERYFRS